MSMPQLLHVGALAIIVRAVKFARELDGGLEAAAGAGGSFTAAPFAESDGAAITSPPVISPNFK